MGSNLVHPYLGIAQERQRDMRAQAQQELQASRVRRLRRASRRAERAEQHLTRAMNEVLRVRSQLNWSS
jgi:transcription initiation factor TFIIIB Brf1 subunit/transcription initiation factor TFIIB